MRLSLRTQRALQGYLFVSPWIIGFLMFILWPLVFSLWLSLHQIKEFSGLAEVEFIGTRFYQEAFVEDTVFLPAFAETMGNLLLDLPIVLVFSLMAALLVSRPIPGVMFFRSLFFLPVILSSYWLITLLFDQGAGRLAITRDIVELRNLVGLYLGEGALQALFDVLGRITFVVWGTGVQILVFIAALYSIPGSLYEAAKVDGASNWEIFWEVTLPLLSPFILVNVVYTIVKSSTDPFNLVLPYIQRVALSGTVRLDYASALGWIYFVGVFLVLAVALAWAARFVFYAGER